jgi:putative nucleotidyltransferase with HDIG domain
MTLRRTGYRLWQFVASLRALFFSSKEGEAVALLGPAEYTLFRRMARYDRAHALRVLRWLKENGAEDPVLWKAALLHDLGKSAGREGVPLLCRGPIVLARGCPRLWRWLSRERPAGHLLRPFYLYATHAARGAEMAHAAGCPEEVVALVAIHHDAGVEGAGRLLQEADQQS